MSYRGNEFSDGEYRIVKGESDLRHHARTALEKRRPSLESTLVVDLDVHVHDTPRELLPYCERRWKDSLERAANHHEHYLDVPGYAPGGNNTSDLPTWPSGHEGQRIVTDVSQLRSDLRRLSIDLALLFPDGLLKIAMLSNADYAAALASAYNAWLLERWCQSGSGLLACLAIAPQSPARAVKEIVRYAQDPSVVGVYLPCCGLPTLWGHDVYSPIFAAASEARLPVFLHSVASMWPVYPFNVEGFTTQMARHTTAHSFSIMANLVDMISGGVTTRYPDLRIVATEAGVSWVPFLGMRMDREFFDKHSEVPFLTERPSDHLRRNCYYATQPVEEPEDLRDFVHLVEAFQGEENVVFASDWPHHDFDSPVKLWQMPFSDEVRRAVFGENALRLLSIDAEGRRV